MSLWEQAVSMKRFNGGGTDPSPLHQGDFIYIGEFTGGAGETELDAILDKFIGGLDTDTKECKTCPYAPQKKSMEWVVEYIEDYLESIANYI